MLDNFRTLRALYQLLGARWLLFRIGYALRMRTGWIRRQMPAYAWRERPLETWLKEGVPSASGAYAGWRQQHAAPFFFRPLDSEPMVAPRHASWDLQPAIEEAERLLNGELKYFAHRFVRTGFPPDWHADPVSGKRLDARMHWSRIPNDADVDIKFIWEASRFSMVYTLVRAYAVARDPKFAEAFWRLVQSWAEANPPNTGPNWMDGQEAALRLMAWTFGFQAFRDAPATSPERMAQFTVLVAAHAGRIHKNIGYAISTRSNHTISEAFGLWLVGLLFPELRDARKYFVLGRRLLEQEAMAQIFPDGSYAMYSLNYHRFILQIYLYAVRLGELNGSPFSTALKDRVAGSVDFLLQLIDRQTGQMPGYGSNDGALVLPLNNCDFSDYRPVLQLGSCLLKGQLPFEPGPWDEDLFWLCGAEFASARDAKIQSRLGVSQASFPEGGIYLLRGANSQALIRCSDFRSRPSHADQLHVDLWWRSMNIACDAGTYLYNGEGIWRNGLARTSVHNAVTVDGRDQMQMVSRFTWTNWAKGRVLRHNEHTWQGEHDGYARLADPVHHRRTLLSLGADRWLVVDHLLGKQPHHYALHWLLADVPYEQSATSVLLSLDSIGYKVQAGLRAGEGAFSVVRADSQSTRGWRSQYYGDKEPAISVILETTRPQAGFWTFFGFPDDQIELIDRDLQIGFDGMHVSIDLHSPQL